MAAARRAREQQLEQPAASAGGDATRNVEERLLVLEKSVDSIFDALNKALLQQVTIIKDCHKAVLGEWRKALVASLPAAQALPAPAVPEPVLPVTAEPSSWPTQESGGLEDYEGTEASNEMQEGARVLRKRTRKRRVSRPAKRAHLREESMGEEEAQRPPEAATAPARSLQTDAPQLAAAGSPATSSTASRPMAPSASATSLLECGAAVRTAAILPEAAFDAPAAKEEMGAMAEDAAATMGQHSRRPKRRKKALAPSDSDVPTPPSSVGPASQQLPAASQPAAAESELAACSGVPCAEPLQSRPSASETEVLAPPRSVGPGGRDLPTATTTEQPSRASAGTPPLVAAAEPEELLADQVSAEAREGEEEGEEEDEEEGKEEVDEEVEEMPRPSVVAPLPEPSEKERASPPKWMQPLQLDPNSYHSEDELRWEWYKSGRAVTFPEWCSKSGLAYCHPSGQKKHGSSKTRGLATANPEVDQSPLCDESPAQPPQSLQAGSEHQDAQPATDGVEEPATTAGASPQQQEPPSRHPSSPSSAAGLPEPAAEGEQQAAETSVPELPPASECSQEDSLAPPDASPQVPPQGSRGRRRAGKHREASPELPTLQSTPQAAPEPLQPPVLAAEAVEMADNTSSPGNPAENAPSDNDCTPELDALAESFLDDLADIDEGKPTATLDMAAPDMAEALLDDLAADLDAEPSRPEEAPGDSQPLDSWSPDLPISGSPGASSPKGTDPDQPTICNPASQKRLPGASSQTPQKRSAQKRPGKRKRALLEKEEEEEQPAGTQGPATASAAAQAAASPSFPSASFPSSASTDPVQGAVEQQSNDVLTGDAVDVPSKDCSVETEPSLVPAAEAERKLDSFIQQPVELHPKTFYSEDELHWEWYKSGRQQSFPEWFQSHPCKSPWGGGLHAAKKAVSSMPQDEAEAGAVIATSTATDAALPPTPPPPLPTPPAPSASKERSTPVVPPPPTPPAPNQVPGSKSPRLAQSSPPAPASRAPPPLATSAPSGSQMPETAVQLERATGAQHAAPASGPAQDVGLETLSTGKKKKQEWFQQRYAQAQSQAGERPAPKQLPRKRPTSRHGEKLQGGEDRWPDFPPLPRSQSPPSAPRPAPSEVSHQPLVPVDDVLPPLM